MADNIKFSQDFEIIPPQKQRSYPISITEWGLIKKKISAVKDNANFWHTTGSILIGATVITLITSLTLIGDTNKIPLIIWVSATILTGGIGGFAFYFGNQQKETQNKSKEDVIDFMTTIEDRFQNSAQTAEQEASRINFDFLLGRWQNELFNNGKWTLCETFEITNERKYLIDGKLAFNVDNFNYDSKQNQITFTKAINNIKLLNTLVVNNNELLTGKEKEADKEWDISYKKIN